MFRLFTLAIGMAALLSACQTTENHIPSQPIGKAPPAADEFILFDSLTWALPYQGCHGCPKDGGPVQVRVRLNGNNFIYQIAYAPLPDHRFDLNKLYNVEIKVWFNGRSGYSTILRDISFDDAKKETGPDGRSYYVTDWMWSGVHYNITSLGTDPYIFGKVYENIRNDRLKTLKAFHDNIAAGVHMKPWQLELTSVNYKANTSWHAQRTLHGDAAIAALKNPQAAYEQHFAAMDAAIFEDKAKTRAAQNDNKAYKQFVALELEPLTFEGIYNKAKCPALPYRLEYNYHPAQTFYDEAEKSLRRADCLNKVLANYDPGALADRYEQLSEEETALFEKTHGIKRFSLKDAHAQSRDATAYIRTALNRADYLFEGGDYTARKRAQTRRAQQQQRAQMQGLMAGLQGLQSSLQQRHDAAASRVARLQAQGVENHRRKLQAQRNQLSATARSATSNTASASSSSGSTGNNNSSSGQQTAKVTAPKGPMIAAYQAASSITSLSKDIAHCDPGGAFDSTRIHEVKCTAVKLVRLPMLSPYRVKKCTGNPEVDVIDAHEGAIIGAVIRMQSVSRGELEKLRAIGKQRTNHLSGLFFEQGEPQASNELIEWKYRQTRQGTVDMYFRDRTELRTYVRNNNCAAILWTRVDGSTHEERLDRVR